MAIEYVLHHFGHGVRAEGVSVDLAHAFDAVVGNQLEEHEIAAAEGRRRIADDEGLKIGDFHGEAVARNRGADSAARGPAKQMTGAAAGGNWTRCTAFAMLPAHPTIKKANGSP